jgi:glycosyltransferase involved in cell wall biosynthesis
LKLQEIDVIIGVYNGEEYLTDMLQSLKSQKGVLINLIVTDDGSLDSSISIVKTFSNAFNSLVIVNGPKHGPAENFFSALKFSNSAYLAFADQDDIWRDDHLVNSIARLQNFGLEPALTFCAVQEFKTSSSKVRKWPKKHPSLELDALISENPARGCTMVMNKKATTILRNSNPRNAIMHDWWALLLIKLVGKVVYSDSQEVRYRIHQKSVTYGSRKFVSRFSRLHSSINGLWSPELQLNSVLENISIGSLDLKSMKQIQLFNSTSKKSIIFYRNRLRMRLLDEIAIRFFLMIRKRTNE